MGSGKTNLSKLEADSLKQTCVAGENTTNTYNNKPHQNTIKYRMQHWVQSMPSSKSRKVLTSLSTDLGLNSIPNAHRYSLLPTSHLRGTIGMTFRVSCLSFQWCNLGKFFSYCSFKRSVSSKVLVWIIIVATVCKYIFCLFCCHLFS